MTSSENNEETVTFFEKHNYFGYPKESIKFFIQGNLGFEILYCMEMLSLSQIILLLLVIISSIIFSAKKNNG